MFKLFQRYPVDPPDFQRMDPNKRLGKEPHWQTPAGRAALIVLKIIEVEFLGSGTANFQRVTNTAGTYYDGYDGQKDKNEYYRNSFWNYARAFETFKNEGGDLEDPLALFKYLNEANERKFGSQGLGSGYQYHLGKMIEAGADPRCLTPEDVVARAEKVAQESRER